MRVFQNKFSPCWTRQLSMLRSNGVGNHDAQTREKLLDWFSVKRPQKACFSPLVIAHQNNSTRCSLRARQIFRQFFEYAAAVLQFGGHIYWEWPAECAGWSSVELRNFRTQQKSCGRELFMTACDSCFFAKRGNNLLERRRWQFLTSDPRFIQYMSLQCQGNHEHVWIQKQEGKREYPVAMIRRSVDGFVHDLRPLQFHMFLSDADHLLSVSPAVFVASPAQETEDHRLHVAGGHVLKTSLKLLLQRRGCPVWMQHMVDQLQCDSCLESSDAQNAQRVSLATPPKTVAGTEGRYLRIRRLSSERFLCTSYGPASKMSSCSCFLEGNPRQRFEPIGATLVDALSATNCENEQVSGVLVS